ncbi:MAG: internalization-related competence protein ComEC/Rec2 [Paucimonas sp.]|nr:internalization-related competence protein ComEC/Rec2 [Paucimonas sp.]
MRAAIAGLLAGTCFLQTRADLPDPTEAWALLAAGVALALLATFGRRPLALRRPAMKLPLLLLAGAICGFAWASLLAQQRLATALPLEAEGRDIDLVGIVDSLPQRFERGVRFHFRIEQAATTAALPPRIALSWYASDEDQAGMRAIAPGERWQLRARLRRPHGNANPHGFDYEAWLLEQNVRATGYVRPGNAALGGNRRLQSFVPNFSTLVERSRALLRDRIMTALEGKPYSAIVVALVIGDQRDISPGDWKVFTATGVGHLISISGLHITMIAGLFASAVLFLWRRSFFTRAQLPLLLPAQKAAALAGALCALLYVLLSGFGVPAQRTLYMLAVVALALWCGRAAQVSHVLALALGLVLLVDPWAVLWPGFWLSFGAVAVILYAGSGQARSLGPAGGWRASLRAAVRTQWAISIGLVPLSLLLFSQVSLVSPLANAVAIPVVSFIVTPLALAGSVLPAPLSGAVLMLAHQALAWLAALLTWLSTLPGAVWSAPAPDWWMFFAALAGLCWMLAPRGWPWRSAGLLVWLPLLLKQPLAPAAGVNMIAFDVGQGTAVLIETAGHRLLYDTGPWYTPEADGGSRVILPYLKARGIDYLDTVVVSHNDNDHSGGALSVLGQVRVGRMLSSLDEASPVVRAAAIHSPCRAGQRWDWDGVRFEMLHPDDAEYQRGGRPNGRSCTLKLSFGAHSILLPGDIEAPQEARLLSAMPRKLRANVLLVPHHGSGTSSTQAFLDAVQPQLAIFQVGYRNRYRHPKAEVVERYGRMQVQRLRTDETGAVQLAVGQDITVETWRQQHARYWQGR